MQIYAVCHQVDKQLLIFQIVAAISLKNGMKLLDRTGLINLMDIIKSAFKSKV